MRIIDLALMAIVAFYIIGVAYFIYSDASSRLPEEGGNPVNRVDIERVQRDLLNKVWNDLRIMYDVDGYIRINETVTIIDSTIEVVITRNQSTSTYIVRFNGDPQVTGIFREIHNVTLGDIVVGSLNQVFVDEEPIEVSSTTIDGINVRAEKYSIGRYMLTLFIEERIDLPIRVVIEFGDGRITLDARSINVFQ